MGRKEHDRSVVRGLVFFAGALAAFVIPSLWMMGRQAVDLFRFDRTSGRVTAVQAGNPTASSQAERRGWVEYEFDAGGARFAGRFPSAERAPMPESDRLLEPPDIAVGDAIEVRFDPADPARNTHRLWINPAGWSFVTFAMVFVVLGYRELFMPRSLRPRPVGTHGAHLFGSMFLTAYVFISAVLAFGFAFTVHLYPWPIASFVGLWLPTLIVPVLAWLVARITAEPRHRHRGTPERRDADQSASGFRKEVALLLMVTLVWWGCSGVFIVEAFVPPVQIAIARASWSRTTGTIERSGVAEHRDRKISYEPVVEYRYAVDGREQVGDRYQFSMFRNTMSRAEAIESTRQYVEGTAVTVYYDPGGPGRSVLSVEMPTIRWFMLIFMTPFALIGIGLVWVTTARIWALVRRESSR